jgi:hypothetical protein
MQLVIALLFSNTSCGMQQGGRVKSFTFAAERQSSSHVKTFLSVCHRFNRCGKAPTEENKIFPVQHSFRIRF